jgi:hypothetical protein
VVLPPARIADRPPITSDSPLALVPGTASNGPGPGISGLDLSRLTSSDWKGIRVVATVDDLIELEWTDDSDDSDLDAHKKDRQYLRVSVQASSGRLL